MFVILLISKDFIKSLLGPVEDISNNENELNWLSMVPNNCDDETKYYISNSIINSVMALLSTAHGDITVTNTFFVTMVENPEYCAKVIFVI